MNTLSNVPIHGGESKPPSTRFALGALPEAKSLQTGVSVRYAPTPDKQWYVMRATYGREDKAAEYLLNDGTYAYIPKRKTKKLINGKWKSQLETLTPNLLFVYATPQQADAYVKRTSALPFLSYYFNHFAHDEKHNNPPLTIPNHEMENFILATSNQSEHLRMVSASQCHFKGGETVVITDGLFVGVRGRVARVAGQQRVVVTLSQIGWVSTAYIPTAFLWVVEP